MNELSPAQKLAKLPKEQREKIVESFTADEKKALLYDWHTWGRPNQMTPEWNWRVWLLLAGRGFGKTRCGSEFIRQQVNANKAKHIALVAPTAADARDTMIEGESGLMGVFPPDQRPNYEPSKRRITFHNGAIATSFSADEPDRLRGPNHDLAWCDELASWRYPEAWDMLNFGLRIGENPRVVVTTTPKPITLIKNLIGRDDVHITRGSTFDNAANLATAFLDEVTARYEGTRLGRQELHAEILDDADGALWNREMLDANRVTEVPYLKRIVIAIDPAISSTAESAETGIIAIGIDERNHGYVLEDRSTRGTPREWASQAIALYHTLKADRIIAESNQGGDMVKHTLNTVDNNVPIRLVHASRGKRTRAEPVASLYEQGRVHHVGAFNKLEDQLCSWVAGESDSPDRLDALVWGVTELLVGTQMPPAVIPSGLSQSNPWAIK
jgi:phage terminase large subunit-like protein